MDIEEQNILITGGLGYIGSHTVIYLAQTQRYRRIIIVDDLSNSSLSVLDRIMELNEGPTEVIFENFNLTNKNFLSEKVFEKFEIHHIIHLAASKSVSESIKKPLLYFENNIIPTVNLLKWSQNYGCKSFILASTAAVYSEGEGVEDASVSPETPYGKSKEMCESILEDYSKTNPSMQWYAFRIFNPIGAHPSGKLGENPTKASNIMPIIQEVAMGKREKLSVFSENWDLRDKSPKRDYIHVMDIAKAHQLALEHSQEPKVDEDSNFLVLNIWTGKLTSVLELVKKFQETNNLEVPYEITEKREGDIELSKTSSEKSKRILKFEPEYNVEDAWEHAWGWMKTFKELTN